MTRPIRFGVQIAPQGTTWDEMQSTWRLVDDSGYDTAWTFDHFYAPIGDDPSLPCFEGWMALAALAAGAPHVEIGVLVTGVTYRHPAVLANMAATLDHSSGGRLIFGIGAAWFEAEHTDYGIPFPPTAERIARLDEAVEVVKKLWTEKRATFRGRYYELHDAYCEPKPLRRPHPPIMIGGGGEKRTLRVVARHADQWNTFGSPDDFRRKIGVLREHCREAGRSFDEIEISWAGGVGITHTPSEKDTLVRAFAEVWKVPPEKADGMLLVGTREEVRERVERFIEAGVTHFIVATTTPYDLASIRGFADEVIPRFRRG
jgi:F420-dependent oxidoreductase-like protein